MPALTVDVSTNYSALIDYVHVDVRLYDNETRQSFGCWRTGAVGVSPAVVRVAEFPGLSRRAYTLIVQLIDVNLKPVDGRVILIAMTDDRVTRVNIPR